MTDRNYLAQFNAYYYEFGTKKVWSHREIFFVGQYPKWGDEFTFWNGTWNLKSSSGFSIKIADSGSEDKGFTRHLEVDVPAWDFKGDFKLGRAKGQEAGFHTVPLFEDKRYWLKNYSQLNLDVTGAFTIGDKKTTVDSENTPWDASFNDWSGVFGHKSYFRSTWMFLGKHSNRNGETKYDHLSYFGNMGLVENSNARAEIDTLFMDKKAIQMEPSILWPNTDDFMDEWRVETHTEMRYTTKKLQGFFRPEAMFERWWDIGILREEERLCFGEYDMQGITTDSKEDQYSDVKGYGFSWDFYVHW